MKFLAILCLLALTSADEDKTQDKNLQQFDAIQNTSSLTQPTNTFLNGQVFAPTSFSSVFPTIDPVANLAYSGFNANVFPVQAVNPDLFVSPASGAIPVNAPIPVNNAVPVNGAIPSFPVTKTVLPGTAAVVNGLQSAFPVTGNSFPVTGNAFPTTGNTFPVASNTFPATGNVFPATGNVFPAIPATVNAVPTQFPAVGAGFLPTGAIDPNTPAAGGVISPVAGASYRFLTPDALSGFANQGLQAAQQVGLAAIPAFTAGILPSLTNGALQGQLQGQNFPAGIQQVLKNPTGNPAGVTTGIPNTQGLANGPSGPLTAVFRHA